MSMSNKDRQSGQQFNKSQDYQSSQQDTITIVTGPGTTELFQPATSGSSKTHRLHLRNAETGQTMNLEFIDRSEYNQQQTGKQASQSGKQVWEIIQS